MIVTPKEFVILNILAAGPATFKAIQRHTLLDHKELTQLLDDMKRGGYIEENGSGLLHITEAAKAAYNG